MTGLGGSERSRLLAPRRSACRSGAAAAAAAPGDVVTLGPGCLVAAGWLERLRDAAANEAGVATASALGAARVVAAGTVTSPSGWTPQLRRSPPRRCATARGWRGPRAAASTCGVQRWSSWVTATCLISAASARGACTVACSTCSPMTCSSWTERLRPAARTRRPTRRNRATRTRRRAPRPRRSVRPHRRARTRWAAGRHACSRRRADRGRRPVRGGPRHRAGLARPGCGDPTCAGGPARRHAAHGRARRARRGGGRAPTSSTGHIRSRRRPTSPCWAGWATGWSSPTRT